MATRRKTKKANPTDDVMSFRKRTLYFLHHGARHEAEAAAMARAELYEESIRDVRKILGRKKRDLTDAAYLDGLGVECAREMVPKIRQGAAGFGLSLPLDDDRVNHFINEAVRVMDGARKLDWVRTPTDRQTVFLNALFTEFQRQGIAG